MVDIEAVAWPLMIANARERAVQAVAEPVQREADDRQVEPDRRHAGEPVRGAGAEHRDEREARQVIRVDAGRHPASQRDEHAFLEWRQHAGQHARGVGEGARAWPGGFDSRGRSVHGVGLQWWAGRSCLPGNAQSAPKPVHTRGPEGPPPHLFRRQRPGVSQDGGRLRIPHQRSIEWLSAPGCRPSW